MDPDAPKDSSAASLAQSASDRASRAVAQIRISGAEADRDLEAQDSAGKRGPSSAFLYLCPYFKTFKQQMTRFEWPGAFEQTCVADSLT